MVSEKFNTMVLKNKDLLRKYLELESRKTGGGESDSAEELTETEDIEEVVDSYGFENISNGALTSKLVRTSMPNILDLEDGSVTSTHHKSQPGAATGTGTGIRALVLRPSKSLPSISPQQQVGGGSNTNGSYHYPSLSLQPLPPVTFRVDDDDDEKHETRQTDNEIDIDNGNNTDTESETDTTDTERSDSEVLLIPAQEKKNRSTEENISKAKKRAQLFPFPEHVSLLDTIFKVIRVQVHPEPPPPPPLLEKPLLQKTVSKSSSRCSPGPEVTVIPEPGPGPSSSSFGLTQCVYDAATILTGFSETTSTTTTTTTAEETIVETEADGKIDELKPLVEQEPGGGADLHGQGQSSTRSSSFVILSISSTAAKTPSPKSDSGSRGNGFFFRLFKKTKSKSESKLRTMSVTTDTDKEDADLDLDGLTNSTSSDKKSAKTNTNKKGRGKDKGTKTVGKVHEVPIKIEVVGYFDDTNFTTMKLSNSMKVWLCDKPTDILVIKDDGSLIDPKQASESRKARKLKKSHCHSHRSSPVKSIKSSFVKIYDHLFTKKDKDLNSLSEELTQKLVTSSSLEGLEIKISASDTDPELSSNSGPGSGAGSGSNSHFAPDAVPVPGPSTSSTSTSYTRNNKHLFLSSYEIVDVQEKIQNQNQD